MPPMNPKEVFHNTATQFDYLTQPVTPFKSTTKGQGLITLSFVTYFDILCISVKIKN